MDQARYTNILGGDAPLLRDLTVGMFAPCGRSSIFRNLTSLTFSYMCMEYHALLHVLKRSHTKTLYYLEDLETESGVARHADSELG